MKSLKKLAIVAAVVSAMTTSAKADSKEVAFAPTEYEGGKIEHIELVNGQILVRSNGEMEGTGPMPYTYVGTNTQHFASNGFAQGGLTNLTQYVHAGEGKIYMTAKDNTTNVWTTSVSSSPVLNGVKNGVKKVEDTANDAVAQAILARANDSKTLMVKIVNGDVFTLVDDGVRKNGKSHDRIHTVEGKEKTDFFVAGDRAYVLTADGNLYGAKHATAPFTNVQLVAPMNDQQLLVVDGTGAHVLNGASGEYSKDSADLAKVAGFTLPAGSEKIVSAFVANNTMYYATEKKLGYRTME